GVVRTDAREFVLADIPGLIEGAHEGVGLGDRFLGHIERCRVLLHLVDGLSEDAGKAYRTVRTELDAYGHGLADKPEIVAPSKGDGPRSISAGCHPSRPAVMVRCAAILRGSLRSHLRMAAAPRTTRAPQDDDCLLKRVLTPPCASPPPSRQAAARPWARRSS